MAGKCLVWFCNGMSEPCLIAGNISELLADVTIIIKLPWRCHI